MVPNKNLVSESDFLEIVANNQSIEGGCTISSIKEMLAKKYPEITFTLLDVAKARTEAVTKGFVEQTGYVHTLTPLGQQQLATVPVMAG
ncbi:MAG: hypothetical protein WC444_00255 [Candidatus Paceibacterota bacterium]